MPLKRKPHKKKTRKRGDPDTITVRDRRYRDKRKREGFSHVRVFVPNAVAHQVRDLAQKLRKAVSKKKKKTRKTTATPPKETPDENSDRDRRTRDRPVGRVRRAKAVEPAAQPPIDDRIADADFKVGEFDVSVDAD